MKIKDIKKGMGKLEIIGKIISKTDPVMRNGKLYSTAILEDETGTIKLNLWRQQAVQIKVGHLVKVTDGFVQQHFGHLRLSTWSDILFQTCSEIS